MAPEETQVETSIEDVKAEPQPKVIELEDNQKIVVEAAPEETPVEAKRVVFTQTITEDKNLFNGTLNDLQSEITMLQNQIASLQAQCDEKQALYDKLSTAITE